MDPRKFFVKPRKSSGRNKTSRTEANREAECLNDTIWRNKYLATET